MSAPDGDPVAEQLHWAAIRQLVAITVREELTRLFHIDRPPGIDGIPPLHDAAPIRAKALGPLAKGGCEAVTYDGNQYRRCSHPASKSRNGHPCCGVHGREDRPEPRWADADGGYTGI